MFDVSIVLLAYNEEQNLRKILPEIKHYSEKSRLDYEIIVVDTMTPTDNTQKVCEQNGVLYVNQVYKGFGGALKTGIALAKKNHIMTIDSDGAHNPKYIPQMVELFSSNSFDVVIGSRYVKGGGTQDPLSNVIMSKLLNWTYSMLFEIKARDLSTNFRMYNSEDIKDISLCCENYDVLQEILIKMKHKKNSKLVIGEFPIILEKRISGDSKRKLVKFIISYIRTLVALKMVELKD